MNEHNTESVSVVNASPGAIVVPPEPEEPRRQWVLYVAVAVFLVLLLGLGTWFLTNLTSRNSALNALVAEQSEVIAEQDDRIADLTTTAQELYDQLLAAGETPEEARPEDAEPLTGPAGRQGDPGIKGDKGDPGEDGEDGLPGAPGGKGEPGETVVGPKGDPGQDGQDGATGAPGATGAQGEPGRGVASVECVQVDPLVTAFRFTFTDNTTQDVLGSCIPAGGGE